MDKKETNVDFVYVGRRHSTKGKIIYVFEYVDLELHEKEGQAIFERKLHKFAIIGTVVSCVKKGDDTYGGFTLKGMLDDEKRVESFRTKSALFENELALKKAATKKYPSAIDKVVQDIADIVEGSNLNAREITYLHDLIKNDVWTETMKRKRSKR